MKFGIKIIVALAVVVAIGFGVWAFFFKEKEEVSGYNRVLEIIEYKTSLDLENKLDELYKFNTVGTQKPAEITDTNDYGKQILSYKDRMFDHDVIIGTNENQEVTYKYLSYAELDKIIDEVLRFYLPYMQTSFIQGNYADGVTNAVNIYKTRAKDLLNKMDEIKGYHKKIELSDNPEQQLDVLGTEYFKLVEKYREYLNAGVDLIFLVEDYIHIGIYENNFIYDEKTILYNCFARGLKVAVTSEIIKSNLSEETGYLSDLYYVIDKLSAIQDPNKNIYDGKEYTKYEFISGYSNLDRNYSTSLDVMFKANNFTKIKMIDNDTESLSQVNNNAKQHILMVLNILGFKEKI